MAKTKKIGKPKHRVIVKRETEGGEPLETPPSEEMIDETLAESFPASDPPSWTMGREREKSVIKKSVRDSK